MAKNNNKMYEKWKNVYISKTAAPITKYLKFSHGLLYDTWPVQESALQIVYLCIPQMDKQKILFTQMWWIDNKEFGKK
jgi:hypothetical protein